MSKLPYFGTILTYLRDFSRTAWSRNKRISGYDRANLEHSNAHKNKTVFKIILPYTRAHVTKNTCFNICQCRSFHIISETGDLGSGRQRSSSCITSQILTTFFIYFMGRYQVRQVRRPVNRCFWIFASDDRKLERALEVKSFKRNNSETTWRRELRFLLFEMGERAGGPSEVYM